jgi:hypothetical protein
VNMSVMSGLLRKYRLACAKRSIEKSNTLIGGMATDCAGMHVIQMANVIDMPDKFELGEGQRRP